MSTMPRRSTSTFTVVLHIIFAGVLHQNRDVLLEPADTSRGDKDVDPRDRDTFLLLLELASPGICDTAIASFLKVDGTAEIPVSRRDEEPIPILR